MYIQSLHVRFLSLIIICVFIGTMLFLPSYASRLSDLVKQTPQLYLPSQIIPGKTAVFTLKGKAGRHFNLILSSKPSGMEIPSGVPVQVGEPTVEYQGTLPSGGVSEIKLSIPENLAELADKQFVAAIVWSMPDLSDAEEARIIDHSGIAASKNVVIVGLEPDKGNTLFIPGDPGMSGIIRSLSIMNEVGNDERKKQLIDDGKINRERQLDKTLNLTPVRQSP